MPTLYTSDRLPGVYTHQDPTTVKNGTLAKASLFNTMAGNQTFLACGLTPFINFFLAQHDASTETGFSATGVWTNSTHTVQVLVPPFCQYVEFYFFAGKQFDSTATTEYYIEMQVDTDADTTMDEFSRISHIPSGEDEDHTGKSGDWGDYLQGGAWVRASGAAGALSRLAEDPGALKVVTSPVNYWRRVGVDVVVSEKVYVRAAAYHVLPGNKTYTITY